MKQAIVRETCPRCGGYREGKIKALFTSDADEIYTVDKKETFEQLTDAETNLLIGRTSWTRLRCPNCDKEHD